MTFRWGCWLLLLLAYVPGASAWNETGHMIAALVAYDRMAPEMRTTMAQLVHSHPRFREDFAPRLPKGLRNATAAEQDRWYFAFAATWPDVARRFDRVSRASTRAALVARYNRSSWHYINLPTYLQKSDRRRLNVKTPSMQWSAGLDESHLNAVQALQMLTATWCTGGDADRALALAWIAHLIADLHQPLHATALFAYPMFIRGDRGGNDIAVTGDAALHADNLHADNLHALWDGALGSAAGYKQLEALARDYARRESGAPPQQDGGDLSGNFQAWAKDARAIAARDAYTVEVLAAAASAADAPPRVAISGAYRDSMHAVAVRQVAAAGRRIASVLTVLAGSGTANCSRQSH